MPQGHSDIKFGHPMPSRLRHSIAKPTSGASSLPLQ